MEIIVADYVGMIQKANRLWQLVSKMASEISRLRGIMNDIDIFWDGEANNEFKLALNGDFAVMESLCLKIKASANLLNQAVNDYVKTENELNVIMGG